MLYFDSVREYLVPNARRNGIAYLREGQAAAPPPEAAPARTDRDIREAVLEKLKEYFSSEGRFALLRGFVEKEAAPSPAPVSLRLLEFLCTDNGVTLQADTGVTDAYQHMLKAHSKAFFDIFARGERIDFRVGEESVKTTIAQLQFFKWAMERGLLQQVEREKESLLEDAKRRPKKAPLKKSAERRHRTHQLVARVRFDGPFKVDLPLPK